MKFDGYLMEIYLRLEKYGRYESEIVDILRKFWEGS